MDRFKLVMKHSGFDQNGKIIIVCHEFFKTVQRFAYLIWAYGNKVGISRPRSTYPVLESSKLPRHFVATASTCQQNFMNFPYESQGYRACMHPFKTRVEGLYIR